MSDRWRRREQKEGETTEKEEVVVQTSEQVFPCSLWRIRAGGDRYSTRTAANPMQNSTLEQIFLDRNCGLWKAHAGADILKDCSL